MRDTPAQLRGLLAAVPGDTQGFAHLCESVDDWDGLLKLARDHGVAAVVLAEVAASGVTLPGDVAHRAELAQTRDSMFLGVLSDTLVDVLRTLAREGIVVVPLKGPLLAERLYAAPDHRPSTDLDVLVLPEDLDRAVSSIRQLGYTIEGGASGRYFRRHHHHVHCLHPAGPIVEIHYHAYRGFGTTLRSQPLIGRAIPYRTARWNVAILAPEDELLYLAVHGASHRFERLGWLYDIKLLVRAHPNLDWALVAARADALGLGAVLSLTCGLLSSVLGVRRSWDGAVAPLGALRARAISNLLARRKSAAWDAGALFGFNTILCHTPASAAKNAARVLALKFLNEMPRRIVGALLEAK